MKKLLLLLFVFLLLGGCVKKEVGEVAGEISVGDLRYICMTSQSYVIEGSSCKLYDEADSYSLDINLLFYNKNNTEIEKALSFKGTDLMREMMNALSSPRHYKRNEARDKEELIKRQKAMEVTREGLIALKRAETALGFMFMSADPMTQGAMIKGMEEVNKLFLKKEK